MGWGEGRVGYLKGGWLGRVRVRGEGCWGKGPGRELLRWGGRGKQNLFIKVINDNLFFFKIVA